MKIRGNDVSLSKKYLYNEVNVCRDCKYKNSLRNRGIIIGLLTTLVHEVYMYEKVEFISPKINNWLQKYGHLTGQKIEHFLAYNTVHYQSTEKDYFFYAVNSVAFYGKVRNIDITKYNL